VNDERLANLGEFGLRPDLTAPRGFPNVFRTFAASGEVSKCVPLRSACLHWGERSNWCSQRTRARH